MGLALVMEIRYQVMQSKPRVFRSVCGLSKNEFDLLFPVFHEEWKKWTSRFTFEGHPRQRGHRIRKNSSFPNERDMLLFILYHYRHNPIQELLGHAFNLHQTKVSRWIGILEPLLLKTLRKLKMTPVRRMEELDKHIVESVTMILDGSERPVQRPRYDQKEYYSGKKSGIR